MTLTLDSFIRPSSIEAISLCAARPSMEAAVVNLHGEPPVAPEASTGTQVHGYSQACIEAWKAGETWGNAIAGTCNMAAVDGGLDIWSVRCVQLCAEFIRDLVAKHEITPENVLTEHWLDMEPYGIGRGGTADVILVVPFKRVIIVDFKTGHLDQGDADQHDQIMVYGVAGAATFRADDVEVWLYQPRAERDRRASGATFDPAALQVNARWATAVTARARQPDPELVPGFIQCRHCRALSHCHAAKEWTMRVLEAIQLIGNPTDPAGWGEAIGAAKLAESSAGQTIDAAKAHLGAGGQAVGWKLQAGRTMVSIDSIKAVELAQQAGVVDDLLRYVTVRAEALKALECLAPAVTEKTCAPSLRPVKVTAGAAA